MFPIPVSVHSIDEAGRIEATTATELHRIPPRVATSLATTLAASAFTPATTGEASRPPENLPAHPENRQTEVEPPVMA